MVNKRIGDIIQIDLKMIDVTKFTEFELHSPFLTNSSKQYPGGKVGPFPVQNHIARPCFIIYLVDDKGAHAKNNTLILFITLLPVTELRALTFCKTT